jgi:hypothetical protein
VTAEGLPLKTVNGRPRTKSAHKREGRKGVKA